MFSVNQVNQLYVVKDIKSSTSGLATDAVGTLYGPFTHNDSVYFKYKGVGGLIATDRIKKGKVKWMTFTSADSMSKPLKVVTIAMNSNVNSGNPVVGQDYIINFSFKSYFGMSDEDTYEKHASARAFSTTASDLLRDLALSLAKNMSREVDQPFKIELGYSTSSTTEVTVNSKAVDLTETYTKIILTELEQPWELGRMQQTRPDYSVNFVPVVVSNVERYDWATATVTDHDSAVITNGKKTADLEWFCMGERGDQYRGKDWPLSITTPASMLVDPTKKYDYLIIHFWDDIDNEGPQKSERDMTFVTDTTLSEDLFSLASEISDTVGAASVVADGAHISATKVATPVIHIADNKATITCSTPGATVYYAKDDSAVADPTNASTAYTAGTELDVSTDIYIKAIAYKSGMDTSDVASVKA